MRSTLVVRSIMSCFTTHPQSIFTNNYAKCRTVKCYGHNTAMRNIISAALSAAGIPFTIKQINSPTYHSLPVTIVRLPK